MKKYGVWFLTLFAAVLLTGCMNPAARGPGFSSLLESNGEQAVVYLTRPNEHDGGTVCFTILIDGAEQGCLGTKGFLGMLVTPGEHTIEVKPDAFPTHTLLSFTVFAKPGDKHLFRYATGDTETADVVVSRYTAFGTVFIERIPFEQAMSELSGLNNSVATGLSGE